MFPSFGGFGTARSRSEILNLHQVKLEQISYSRSQPYNLMITNPFASQKRSNSKRSSKLSELTPIAVSELQAEVTHRGRVLQGTLIVDPVIMTSVHSVIEDKNGDVAVVCFYNYGAGNMFDKGKKIMLIEPFYKIAASGDYYVRVEDMADVAFVDEFDSGKKTAKEWKEEGMKHFDKLQFKQALECYQKAIDEMNPENSIQQIMCNISASWNKLEEFDLALIYAICALSLKRLWNKPFSRASAALEKIGLSENSKWCSQISKKLEKKNAKESNVYTQQFEEIVLIMTQRFGKKSLSAISKYTKIDLDPSISSHEFKTKGNNAYSLNRFEEATRFYQQGLTFFKEISTLLCNRALCFEKIGNFHDSILESTCAIILDPLSVKAHYRRANSLMNLKNTVLAKEACFVGLSILPDNSFLLDLLKKLNDFK
jgi:tetratricopeptide (TPR) repeat protein